MKKNSNDLNPDSKDEEINKLKKELKNREKIVISLNEKLENNKNMLQDIIIEKNELKKTIQEYDLKMVDAKLKQYQKLQEQQQKTVHRLRVTKNQLDDVNIKNKDLKESKKEMQRVIEDLENRGLVDFIRGKYPESYLKFKEKE